MSFFSFFFFIISLCISHLSVCLSLYVVCVCTCVYRCTHVYEDQRSNSKVIPQILHTFYLFYWFCCCLRQVLSLLVAHYIGQSLRHSPVSVLVAGIIYTCHQPQLFFLYEFWSPNSCAHARKTTELSPWFLPQTLDSYIFESIFIGLVVLFCLSLSLVTLCASKFHMLQELQLY